MPLRAKLAIALLFALPMPGRALSLLSADQALRAAFPGAIRFEAAGVTLSASERGSLDKALGRRSLDAYAVRYNAVDGAGQSLGSAWMDDEIGKHRPITYLVALDPAQKIVAVSMLTYREAHGLEARSPRFTRQFKGKGADATLTVGQDLDAISGATLSCQTLAFGARKALGQEALYLQQRASQAGRPASEKPTRQEKKK